MQYLFEERAGAAQIILTGEQHRYLFKVRRQRAGETVYLRNLKEQMFYRYHIAQIDKREILLLLDESHEWRVEAHRKLHLGWCLIDPRSIEKVLPTLNEMGVQKITFIMCHRSQKNFRPDFDRWQKILVNSSQQCGRSVMMELGMVDSLENFLQNHPESWMLNFSTQYIDSCRSNIKTIVVGPEGGFTEEETPLVPLEKIAGFDTPLILRSESAACAAAGKILL